MNTLARINARDALIELTAAWEKLVESWNDSEVLNEDVTYTNVDTGEKSNLYPFQKPFDELLEDVREWAWYMADELDYIIARDEMVNKIESLNV